MELRLYNTNIGFIVLSILFIGSMLIIAYKCPCDDILKSSCVRHEIYGVQLNHFIFFAFIGYYFPSYFYLSQTFGILWEFIEYLADINDEFIIKYIGGCLMLNPNTKLNNNPVNHIVYRGEDKFLNPIDKFFGIKNSKIHGWHGSVAEILVNILGFYFGYIIYTALH